MKTLSIAIGCLLIAATSAAQDCKTFLFMSSNAQIEMTIYDKKGKASGVQSWNVTDVKNDGNGFSSTINTLFKDEKGKEITKGTGLYKCSGGMLQADMQMVMPPQPQLQTSEAKLSNAYIEYPYSMNVGESLKDAQMEMDLTLNSGMKSKVNFKVNAVSGKAKAAIEAAGGTVEIIK